MILSKPSVKILAINLNPLNLIEEAGRTCYKSKMTEESHAVFTEMILKRGHESVLEHSMASVRFICDRGVSHEIVRHRLASYSQESTRYCDYNRGHVEFIIPPWVDTKEGTYTEYEASPDEASCDWLNVMYNIEGIYRKLRNAGWKPEQARSILPNSLKTELVMTANFREWRHFFKLRTAKAAHPQMREVAILLLMGFQKSIPIIFDDIKVPQ